MDQGDRDRRRQQAEGVVDDLSDRGVIGVVTTFVDNSGVARMKAFPLTRLPQVAAWGVGFSSSFDRFRADDWIAGAGRGEEPVGDLRLTPDVGRVVPLAAQPGWAWAPGDRYAQSGDGHPQCSRLLLQRVVDGYTERGLSIRAAFEIEWVVSLGDGDAFTPGVHGPGYSMARLIDQSDYCRDLLQALTDEGIAVEQFHPEYAPGQLELSVAAESPVAAADTSVLVRATIRAVGRAYGLRTSYAPKVAVPGVGNGGHVHLSVWRDDVNLMAGGDGPVGLTSEAEAFCAGMLDHLPGISAIGAPSPASYLRLLPSHWAGVYACWGLENREAALRLITGSVGSEPWAANAEVKCVDLMANPYLLLAALLASGSDGLQRGARLPAPVDVDPIALGEDALTERGVRRLPTSLAEAMAAFEADQVLTDAVGPDLTSSILAIRASDLEAYADLDEADLAAATRWLH